MNPSVKKIWNIISTILVALVVILALLLVGVRVAGLQVFTVLSGSMEPSYPTGSLIYVKKVDPYTIREGQVITFMLDENTVATHRVVGIVPDEDDPTVLRFRTKGDANEAEDGGLVHYKNVIGTPVFTIPYLGYLANYIQQPPGMYVAISVSAVLLLLVFLPDLFADDKSGKADGKREKAHARSTAVPVTEHKEAMTETAPQNPEDDLTQVIRQATKDLLTDEEVEALRREVEAGRFDEAAAGTLRQVLIKRKAERDAR